MAMRWFARVAAIFAVMWSAQAFAEATLHKIDVDGRQRSYLVYEPTSGAAPRPVVLVFHGGGGAAEGMMKICGMNDEADKAGFIAVYPNGSGFFDQRWLTWNTDGCCGYSQKHNIDDVRFVGTMLDELAKQYKIDAKRVYATGLSNGAMMCYRLAVAMPDRIAAIAPVGAAMSFGLPADSKPMPVVHFHGTGDNFAPFEGGYGSASVSKINHMPVRECVEAWAKLNGCESKPVVTMMPDVADDGLRVRREVYEPRKDGSGFPVVLYVIEGGGHNWPGRPSINETLGPIARLRLDFGPSTTNISANDIMWTFFKQYSLE